MLIRIIKRLPARVMDGFAVEQFRPDCTYQVDNRLGRYLIAAEYAESLDGDGPDHPSSSSTPAFDAALSQGRCLHCDSRLVLPTSASGVAVPADADYVCVRCERAYRWDGVALQLTRIQF